MKSVTFAGTHPVHLAKHLIKKSGCIYVLANVYLEEAREYLLSLITPPAAERVPLDKSLGRIMAGDFCAPLCLPPCPQSAVDGYALHEHDCNRNKPLVIIKNSINGDSLGITLSPGQAAEVVTGGPLPENTGTVIPRECVEIAGKTLTRTAGISPQTNIKLPGEDFYAGEIVARGGTRVGPGMMAVLAAFGRQEVLVYRRPRVMVLCVGSGVVSYKVSPSAGQVRDANGLMLASLAAVDGGQVGGVEIACQEKPSEAREKLKKMLRQADLVLTTGGAASGKGDCALALLKELGARILFWGMQVKPGSHSGAAAWESKLVVSLSGNPAACAVGYHLLAAPVIRALQRENPRPKVVPALCIDPFPKKGGPRRFIRGHALFNRDCWTVSILPGQKSSMLRSLLNCNSLIDLPAGHSPLEAGTMVSLMLLPNLANPWV